MVNISGDRGGGGGSRGERGPIGPAGRIGSPGLKGDTGKKGTRGPLGVRGDRGPQGSKGDQGVDGSKGSKCSPGPQGSPCTITDLCTWMPHTVVKNLQENEEDGRFFIADPKKDIKREGSVGDIKQWISRSEKHFNLEAERASKSLTYLANGRHALVFKK